MNLLRDDRLRPHHQGVQTPRGTFLRLTLATWVTLVVATTCLISALGCQASNNPTGASVNLINTMNETVVVHCWSRESDLGSVALQGGANYYWSFHPNIFGRTVFLCSFLWKTQKQEFAVWKGSAHADRSPCCSKGPCSYQICGDGFYNALIVDTDDYGPAESWAFFQPWLPNPVGGIP